MSKLVIGIVIIAVVLGLVMFVTRDSPDLAPKNSVKNIDALDEGISAESLGKSSGGITSGLTTNGTNSSVNATSVPTNSSALALPDLTANISVVSVMNNSVNSSVQFLINYTITYKNIGNVGASNVSVSSGEGVICNTGGGYGGGGGFAIPSLNPNQVINYQRSFIMNCYGLWGSSAVIDPSNVLPELNENNNNANVSVSV